MPSISTQDKDAFFEALQQVFKARQNISEICEALSWLALRLSGRKDFALCLYDVSAERTPIRHLSGYSQSFVQKSADLFTACKKGEASEFPQELYEEDNSRSIVIPLSTTKDSDGFIICPAMPEDKKFLEPKFLETCKTSLIPALEMELLKMQNDQTLALLEVGHVVSSTLNLNELLLKIMNKTTEVMRCETSTVYLVDELTNELYFHIISGDPNVGSRLQEIRLPMGKGVAGWCAQHNEPVIVPDAEKDERFFKGADKKSGFVTRSMLCVPMRIKDKVIGVLQVINRIGDIPFNNHDLETLENVANQASTAIENSRLYENIQEVYLSTIEVLATAIDAKDPYTQGHSRRVTIYSVAIAEELGLPQKEIENIRYAGLLHDVGKIGIEDRIIRKPGKLTDEEYAVIRKHPSIGARILKPVAFLADKIPGVLHHHEYFDGRGYPDHLKGLEIPLAGRIICVADAFDAMTTNRPYRTGLSAEIAIGELKKNSGTQFDPYCVDAFLRVYERELSKYFKKDEETNQHILSEELAPQKTKKADEMVVETDISYQQPFPPIHAKDYDPNKPQHSKSTTEGTSESSKPFPPIMAKD